MTELTLYKFIEENEIEYHWHNEDVIAFVHLRDIEEFNKLIPGSQMHEDGIQCHMKEGYFAFWMKDICEYSGIEMKNIFKPN